MRNGFVFVLVSGLAVLSGCDRGGGEAGASTSVAPTPARDPHKVVAEGGALIDVRTPEEFAGKHVEGAKNIPVDDLSTRMGEIPKNKPVVVYCQSGGRSAAAASMLRKAGYDVIDVGSIKNW